MLQQQQPLLPNDEQRTAPRNLQSENHQPWNKPGGGMTRPHKSKACIATTLTYKVKGRCIKGAVQSVWCGWQRQILDGSCPQTTGEDVN